MVRGAGVGDQAAMSGTRGVSVPQVAGLLLTSTAACAKQLGARIFTQPRIANVWETDLGVFYRVPAV